MRKRRSQSEELAVHTIRTLSMECGSGCQLRSSGNAHSPAPVVYCLWQRFLRFDPEYPIWANRDRFVLSNGQNGS